MRFSRKKSSKKTAEEWNNEILKLHKQLPIEQTNIDNALKDEQYTAQLITNIIRVLKEADRIRKSLLQEEQADTIEHSKTLNLLFNRLLRILEKMENYMDESVGLIRETLKFSKKAEREFKSVYHHLKKRYDEHDINVTGRPTDYHIDSLILTEGEHGTALYQKAPLERGSYIYRSLYEVEEDLKQLVQHAKRAARVSNLRITTAKVWLDMSHHNLHDPDIPGLIKGFEKLQQKELIVGRETEMLRAKIKEAFDSTYINDIETNRTQHLQSKRQVKQLEDEIIEELKNIMPDIFHDVLVEIGRGDETKGIGMMQAMKKEERSRLFDMTFEAAITELKAIFRDKNIQVVFDDHILNLIYRYLDDHREQLIQRMIELAGS